MNNQLAPAQYVTIALAAQITGLTEKAIRRKIEEGKWLEGREYRRSSDGGIFISIKGFEAWVEAGSKYARSRYESGSRSTGSGTVSA